MKINFAKISKNIQKTLVKHGPEILTGLGITGMITTTVMAVKATPKALEIIKELEDKNNTSLKPVEKVKATWQCYIPSAITGTLSSNCLIGASSASSKRNAVLATAYKLSESALKEYQDKVVETIGEKKEQAIRDSIAKDVIDRNPVKNNEVIITDNGDTLCYDAISGRYFKSNIDKINKIVNELNRVMLGDMYVSLNDFYYELGLKGTDLGDQLGWNINRGFIDLRFSTQLSEDDTPCMVIDYAVPPRYDYQSM